MLACHTTCKISQATKYATEAFSWDNHNDLKHDDVWEDGSHYGAEA